MPVTPSRVRRAAALVAVLAWLVAAAPVAAHAELEATSPAAGSSVETPPRTVAARFSEELVGDSSLELFAPDGSSVATGGIGPDNPRRLELAAPPEMGPGEYEVRWEAFSADGHLERGTFSFSVLAASSPGPTPAAQESSAPSAEPSPVPTPEPTDAPLPTPSPTNNPGPTSGSDVLIPIVAGIVLLGGLGLFLLRGRGGRRA